MEEVKRDFVPYWKSRERMRRNMGVGGEAEVLGETLFRWRTRKFFGERVELWNRGVACWGGG